MVSDDSLIFVEIHENSCGRLFCTAVWAAIGAKVGDITVLWVKNFFPPGALLFFMRPLVALPGRCLAEG